MSIEDPGWGSASGGGVGDGVGGSDGWAGTPTGGAGGGGSKPPWQQPRILAGAGGALVVILIVVLVVVLTGHHKKHDAALTTTTTPTTSSSPSVSSSATPTVSPTATPTKATSTPKPSDAAGLASLHAFDSAADNVCAHYKAPLTAEENAGSLSGVVRLFSDELEDIQSIPDPSMDASVAEEWENEATVAFQELEGDHISDYNTVIFKADTLAGELGMKICNYGH